MKSLVTILVVALAVLGATSCGSEQAGRDHRSTTDQATRPEDVSPMTEVGVYERSDQPGHPDARVGGVLVKVVETLDEDLWLDWGPGRLSERTPPATPDRDVVVLVWASGPGLTVHGYRISPAGELIIVGHYTREISPGCVSAAFIDGRSHVFTIADPEVTSGMPVEDPEIKRSEIEVGC